MCGEKEVCWTDGSYVTGSPPRVRGKVPGSSLQSAVLGITPACAGKSAAKEFACKDGRDHPRVCGEKRLEIISMHLVRGSPPRVRGKAFLAECRHFAVGITPACAGKRLCIMSRCLCVRDHPRVCGEKFFCRFWLISHTGSPPRVRGKD